ncbi:MAG TPA: ATP-binding protein [Bauldia sp.]|nr:ATP-binding protein [Bauldia sp.]
MPGTEITSDIAAVGTLTDWVAEAARIYLDGQSVIDLQIAATEAVNNIILHAYRGRPGLPISVSLDIGDDRVALVLRDRGEAMPPSALEDPGGTDIRDAVESGRGLRLIRQCVDDLSYRRRGGWNELTLHFFRSNLPRRPSISPSDEGTTR